MDSLLADVILTMHCCLQTISADEWDPTRMDIETQVAYQDRLAQREVVLSLTTVFPPTWGALEKQKQQEAAAAAGEEEPVEEVVSKIDAAIENGNAFAARFPQAFDALLAGQTVQDVALVVHQHQEYLHLGRSV